MARDKNSKDDEASLNHAESLDSSKEEIGNKGSYWTLSPAANDMFERGNYRRRRTRKQRHLLKAANSMPVRENIKKNHQYHQIHLQSLLILITGRNFFNVHATEQSAYRNRTNEQTESFSDGRARITKRFKYAQQ